MNTIVVAALPEVGTSRTLRMLAVGAAAEGATVLFVGGKNLPAVPGLYTAKAGERIAPMRIDMVILDEVATDVRKEMAAAFDKGDPQPVLKRLGGIVGHGATLVVTRALARPPVIPVLVSRPKGRRKVGVS